MTALVIVTMAAVLVVDVVVSRVVLAGHRDDTLVVVLVVVSRVILALAVALIVAVVVRAVVFSVSTVAQRVNIVNAARVLSTGRVMMDGLESTGQRCAP